MVYSTVVSNKPADPLEPIAYRDMATPLGEMRLVASPTGQRGAWFTDQELLPSPDGWTLADDHPILEQANNLYRVRIGPYPDRQSALNAVQVVSDRLGIMPSIASQ